MLIHRSLIAALVLAVAATASRAQTTETPSRIP